jgi:ThiF family/Prokaryotic E2 family A/Prokaryotic homologs of the JAB domain
MLGAALDALFGAPCDPDELAHARARSVLRLVIDGNTQGYRLVETRRSTKGDETLIVRVHVDRPQDFVHPLKAVEPLAFQFKSDGLPGVFSLRGNFPPVPHSTAISLDLPVYLCIDDRPWHEARLSWTPTDFLIRIQRWLAKTARGELHGNDRAPYPLFATLGPVVILPRDALSRMSSEPVAITLYRVEDEARREVLLATSGNVPKGSAQMPMLVLALSMPPQEQGQIRFPPQTLRELTDLLSAQGIDLLAAIQSRINAALEQDVTATGSGPRSEALEARLGVIVAFPMQDEGGTTTAGIDLRGFFSLATVAEIGRNVGCLERTPDGAYGRVLFGRPTASDDALISGEMHIGHDRELAALVSGTDRIDARKVVMIGAGAVGSHVSAFLAREGFFSWTIVDDDHYLPHNVPRHVLPPGAVGMFKARALASSISRLLRDGDATPVIADALNPGEAAEGLRAAFAACDLLLDASASITVARRLADEEPSRLRRMSFFFNPDGTDAVLLVEPEDRRSTLRDLEAQHYAMILQDPALRGHLRMNEGRIAYSGACRQATNRMPETRVAMLSAAIAIGIKDAVGVADGAVSVWRLDQGGLVRTRAPADQWERFRLEDWSLSFAHTVIAELTGRRQRALPCETGGVLLGVADMEARSLHICAALDAPFDSSATPTSFERGIAGLREAIAGSGAETAGQLTYVGEWHSHPAGAPTSASRVDVAQMTELAMFFDANGVPGIMAIAGDEGIRIHAASLRAEPPVTIITFAATLS